MVVLSFVNLDSFFSGGAAFGSTGKTVLAITKCHGSPWRRAGPLVRFATNVLTWPTAKPDHFHTQLDPCFLLQGALRVNALAA